jgi:membrane-bound acyltransferase YfiQ involved in biofilm formation
MNYAWVKNACERALRTWWKTITWMLLSGGLFLVFTLNMKHLIASKKIFESLVTYKFFVSIFANIEYAALIVVIVFIFIYLSSFSLCSRFLSFVGFLSYEIFLIHAVFLYKYDFIFRRLPTESAFIVFLIVMCFLAFCLKQSSGFAAKTVLSLDRRRL